MTGWSGPPVATGLVGAGHWARQVHAPMLAAGPETRLARVWARRGEAAAALAGAHGAAVAHTFDELLDRCEAVAFAVPPDVQAELAIRAAGAGRAVLLEKPIALTVDRARALAAAVDAAGVVSQVVLTNRYHSRTRAFLTAARRFTTTGARACYLHGGFLDGPFATGWRLVHGALLDLGPHALDLLDAAVGPITAIHPAGDPRRWIELTCRHEGGAVSQLSLSGSVRVPGMLAGVELFGADGMLSFDAADIDRSECWPVVRREFATAVRTGRPHPLDVHRGLSIQELIAMAQA